MSRRLAVLAALAAVGVLLAVGTTSGAQQVTRTFVTNTGQAQSSTGNASSDHAQAFTTGSHIGGYGLYRVGLVFEAVGDHSDWDVQIFSDRSNSPGELVATLTRPGSIRNGVHYYQPADISTLDTIVTLASETTYWLVWNNHRDGAGNLLISRTASDTEGAQDGWSLSDYSRTRPHDGGDGDWTTSTESLRVSVEGWQRPPPAGTIFPQPLVSNNGQTWGATYNAAFDRAESFTTGGYPSGYRITSIGVNMVNIGPKPGWDMELWTDSGSRPGSRLVTLNKPDPLGGDLITFPVGGNGIDLSPGTTYWVVWNNHVNTNSGNLFIRSTASNDQDAGLQPDWSIGNVGLFRGHGSTGGWNAVSAGNSFIISVTGYPCGHNCATPAVIPGVSTLVSNEHPTSAHGAESASSDIAQAFTTGDIPQGYTLTAVGLRMTGGTGTAPGHQLSIHADSNGVPGTQLAILAGSLWGAKPADWPDAGATGWVQHFPPVGGLTLAPNTTYWVVTDITGNSSTSSTEWLRYDTSSKSEDTAAMGWSIADTKRWRLWSFPGWAGSSAVEVRPLVFRIHGHPNGPVPPAPAEPGGTPVVFGPRSDDEPETPEQRAARLEAQRLYCESTKRQLRDFNSEQSANSRVPIPGGSCSSTTTQDAVSQAWDDRFKYVVVDTNEENEPIVEYTISCWIKQYNGEGKRTGSRQVTYNLTKQEALADNDPDPGRFCNLKQAASAGFTGELAYRRYLVFDCESRRGKGDAYCNDPDTYDWADY